MPDQMTETVRERKEVTVRVEEKEARDLFIALGYDMAEDERCWPRVRLQARLNRLPDLLEEVGEEAIKSLSDTRHKLCVEVCRVVKSGSSVSLTEEGEGAREKEVSEAEQEVPEAAERPQEQEEREESVGTEVSEGIVSEPNKTEELMANASITAEEQKGTRRGRKPGVKGEKGEKGENGKAEKKPKKDTDKYGFRIGTETAKMNEKLSRKAKTMKELVDEAGLERGLYGHMKRMIEKGFVKEVEENGMKKYALA